DVLLRAAGADDAPFRQGSGVHRQVPVRPDPAAGHGPARVPRRRVPASPRLGRDHGIVGLLRPGHGQLDSGGTGPRGRSASTVSGDDLAPDGAPGGQTSVTGGAGGHAAGRGGGAATDTGGDAWPGGTGL